MRFLLAASLLTDSATLSSVVASSLDATQETEHIHWEVERLDRHNEPSAHNRRALAARRRRSWLLAGNKNNNKNGVLLQNEELPSRSVGQRACDPSADVGALACGTREYCAESTATCQPSRRHLQSEGATPVDICFKPQSPYFQLYDCNCDNFDYDEYVGDITCLIETDVCEDEPLCTDVCHQETYTYSYNYQTGDNSYTFELKFTSPYQQTMVYKYFPPDGSGKCELTLDGVKCNSCSYDYQTTDGTSSTCLEFDCTNTGGNHAGNSCDKENPAYAAPIFGNCAFHDPCSICGGDLVVANQDNEILVAGLPPASCGRMEDMALQGYFVEATCADLQNVANETCGCGTAAPTVSPAPTMAPTVKPPTHPPFSWPPISGEPPVRQSSQRTWLAVLVVGLCASWTMLA